MLTFLFSSFFFFLPIFYFCYLFVLYLFLYISVFCFVFVPVQRNVLTLKEEMHYTNVFCRFFCNIYLLCLVRKSLFSIACVCLRVCVCVCACTLSRAQFCRAQSSNSIIFCGITVSAWTCPQIVSTQLFPGPCIKYSIAPVSNAPTSWPQPRHHHAVRGSSVSPTSLCEPGYRPDSVWWLLPYT